MKVKKVNIYSFNELSEEAKKKVIKSVRVSYYPDYEWYDYIEEDFKASIWELYGIEAGEIFFSGFYNQGDGACFTGSVYVDQYLKATKQVSKYKGLKKYIAEYRPSIDIVHTGHYYHSYSTSLVENYFREGTEKQYDQLYALMKEIEAICIDEANELYKTLQNEYEYLLSDECIANYLSQPEDETQYTASGEPFIF